MIDGNGGVRGVKREVVVLLVTTILATSSGAAVNARRGVDSLVQPETTVWSLDALGNWSGDAGEESVHRFRDADADGAFSAGDTTLAIDHHDVAASNEIDYLLTVDSLGSNGVQPYLYDAAGNLLFNGKHFFTYDAWNRLAAIYEVGPDDVDSNGAVLGAESAWLALERLERFEYDALGRRVRTVLKPGTSEWKTTEHVYGTGAAVLEEYVEIGTTGVQSLARWFIHGESFPDPLYTIDLTAAGDVGAGTEEWLYYLKDALGSVMALVSLDSGSVVERYAYDPYGRTEVLALQIIGFGELAGLESELYHDTDLDGDVDATDAADLMSCIGSTADDCVFFHDRTGNGRVDFVDAVLVANAFGGVGQTGQEPPKGHGRAVPKGINVALEANTNGAGGGAPAFDLEDLESCFGSSDIWCIAAYDEDESGTVDLGDLTALAGEIIIKPPPDVINLRSRFDNPLLWTGQRYDPETGTYQFTARLYLPEVGRFAQRDPMGALSTGAPVVGLLPTGAMLPVGTLNFGAAQEYTDSLSLFAYADHNPITRLDRLGLFFGDEQPEGTLLVTRDWDRIYESFVGNGRAYLGVQGAATWGAFWGGNVTALPDFAGGMAGVSQGMSDFADYYAEAVITLPIEGVLVGIGNFGSYAAVGQASSKGSRFASFAGVGALARGMHNHHPLPKFLGGHLRQFVTTLRADIHRKYHSVLNRTLKARGLPLPVGGKTGSTKAWRRHFEQYPDAQRRAFDAVMDAARIVDEAEGTNIVQDIWRNVMNGAFDMIP